MFPLGSVFRQPGAVSRRCFVSWFRGTADVPAESVDAFYGVIVADDVKTFKSLLLRGHDVTQRDKVHGGTLLHRVVLHQAHAILDHLFACEGHAPAPETMHLVDAPDGHGMTPLHIAAGTGNIRAYRVLLEHGARTDQPDREGSTPLHRAAESGATAIVEDLVAHRRVPVDCPGEHRATPLHFAAKQGHVAIADLLVRRGQADVHACTRDGSTPLHIACFFRRKRMVSFLVDECRADIHRLDHRGNSLLHAAVAGDPEAVYETAIVDLLIDRGLPLDKPNHDGQLPRDLVSSPQRKRLLSPRDAKMTTTSRWFRSFFD